MPVGPYLPIYFPNRPSNAHIRDGFALTTFDLDLHAKKVGLIRNPGLLYSDLLYLFIQRDYKSAFLYRFS